MSLLAKKDDFSLHSIDESELKMALNKLQTIKKEISRVVVGQNEVLDQMLLSFLANGHALMESYPGMGKTLMVKTIAAVTNLKFSRVQSTPDLLPADIIGTYIIQETDGRKTFTFRKGPIFTNIVLADEINRATPKTQSAFLEAMQERQVTVGNETMKLEEPFFVLATQNPIDMEGTYPLPEAQVDRFLMKILLNYPSRDEEKVIAEMYSAVEGMMTLNRVMDRNDVMKLQKLTRMVPISTEVRDYALDIVHKTRNHEHIEFGASPRASIGLIVAGKANALLNQRTFVSKKDIQYVALPVLRHRIILNFQAEKEGLKADDVVKKLL